MEERSLALTIVEPDRALVLSAVELWPDLAAARAGGKAEIHIGNPRWYLRRDRSRYDIILLAAGLSPAAHVAGALSYEERYLYTKEAFRSYAAHLSPGGLLFVRRPGNGRVASTLREAMEGEAGPPSTGGWS
jgi:spermidine synthase